MFTRRTAVSCGANLLFCLDDLTETKLNGMLESNYRAWGSRPRPGGGALSFELSANDRERRLKGEYDNKIYKGETVIFSDADSLGNGQALKDMIRDNNLGRIVSLSAINPNTTHKITTYLWVYNGRKIEPKPTKAKKTAKRGAK